MADQAARKACAHHLEAILSRAGCADATSLAPRLIAAHGSLGELIAATRRASAVANVPIPVVAALVAFRQNMRRALATSLAARPVLADWAALLAYLREDLAHEPVEQLRVLHLNTKNVLIRDVQAGSGTIDECSISIREILGDALTLGSASLILVHNHPSGDPQPSRADITLTKRIASAALPLNIAILDHLIIARSGHTSLRSLGLA